MVHAEYNYLDQIFFGYDVEVRTYITKIGNSSFTIYQEVWQNGTIRANGSTILVYFDFIKQESQTIPPEIREKLQELYMDPDDIEKQNKKEMKENKKQVEELNYIESDL